jgi:hypothetical protein
VVVGSGGLFGLGAVFDDDVVAERLELALQAASAVLGRVALALPVRSEFAERDLVADDAVLGDEHVVAGGAGRLGLADSANAPLHALPAQLSSWKAVTIDFQPAVHR